MQKKTVSVSKEYLKECRSQGATPKPFDINAVDIHEVCEALLKDILEEAIKMSFEEMLQKLNITDSPEAMLIQAATKPIQGAFQAIHDRANEIRKAENTLKPEQIKKKLLAELEEACKSIAMTLETPFKLELAEKRYLRTERNRIRIDIDDQIALIENTQPGQKSLQMTLTLKQDPLYSRDLVQHLIRLRLNDPAPLKNTYAQDADQDPIINANKNRVWIGLYDLSDAKSTKELQKTRLENQQRLAKQLAKSVKQFPNEEICISVRACNPNGSGHYLLFSLVPKGKGDYVMRCINSNFTVPDINQGMPGELLAATKLCGLTVNTLETQVLISQPSNHGCGPTHVEILSAVMSQDCLYGAVPEDYTQQATIKNPALTQEILSTHALAIANNEIAQQALITRDAEESIFNLVLEGEQNNPFGFVPPSAEHLNQFLNRSSQSENPSSQSSESDESEDTVKPELSEAAKNVLESIKPIHSKAKDLKKRGYKNEAKVAKDLHNDLQILCDNFFAMSEDEQAQQLKKFQKNCKKRIDTARPTLEKHRSIWKPILANILLAIAMLVVFYFPVCAIKKAAGGNFFFFSSTKSEQIINQTEKAIFTL